MEQPPPVSWLDSRVRPDESRIEGTGEFAREPFRAGELIKQLGGKVISGAEIERIASSGKRYSALRLGADSHLLMAWDDPASRGNHSCDPNAWLEGAFTVVARRDIAAGEEITTDYATMTVDPGWKLACACGTPLCRGTVTGDDWKFPELRARYAGHFVPWTETLDPGA